MTGRVPARKPQPVLVSPSDHDRLTRIKLARPEPLNRLVTFSEIVHEALDELERAEAS